MEEHVSFRTDKITQNIVTIPAEEVRFYFLVNAGIRFIEGNMNREIHLYFVVDDSKGRHPPMVSSLVKTWLTSNQKMLGWNVVVGDRIPLSGNQAYAISKLGESFPIILIMNTEEIETPKDEEEKEG